MDKLSKFIEKIILKHGDKYDYSKVEYSDSDIKVIIIFQHGGNDGEYHIPETNYKADGYCKETNTIYEFHGDFWHGNPYIFKNDTFNPICKKHLENYIKKH